ncbi:MULTISPECIES: type I-E CRISPR-associated endonuclease Cas1e [unclassified Azospirillum]|uniref:type I-E CRISPR-associated endonuclease Cas1e n=1 Tax=unclassified Azospirillum TaxID=2630922 RepID=UPI000B75B239|nr:MULTISPECIES: type I-E CRISPR-associated endonuclease Cas1e [unclassified Azospirillum]SNT19512.1 CRISPR-associated protein, Cas1 family [Azospirillum sp. RU38E]SNT31334.1 CRISPR-associated protein, Cas1 family [Azospirillum sp. RU37A]
MLKGRLGLDEARIPQKSRNGLIYVERCALSVDNGSLILHFSEKGETLELPYQRLNAILLGPGSSITHDAVRHCSGHGTCLAFVGTDGTRLYTAPPLFDRDSTLARQQATWWASESTRMMVAKRMYAKRFGETPRTSSLDSLRGMEAARIKRSYEIIASQVGITWQGRHFDRANPDGDDAPNQAINHTVTAVEACVAIAVQATGTLPPLGFLHEDSAKSWVLDLCDLYRTTVTVPIAFECVKRQRQQPGETLDRLCRRAVSRHVRDKAFIDTVITDIKEILA